MTDIEAEKLRLVGKLCSIRKADTLPIIRQRDLIGIIAEVREPQQWQPPSSPAVEVRFEGRNNRNYFGASGWVIDVWGEP